MSDVENSPKSIQNINILITLGNRISENKGLECTNEKYRKKVSKPWYKQV